MTTYIEVIPAYGRDYTSQAEVKADWNSDMDFRIADFGADYGRMINKSDATINGLKVIVRYAKQMKVMAVN